MSTKYYGYFIKGDESTLWHIIEQIKRLYYTKSVGAEIFKRYLKQGDREIGVQSIIRYTEANPVWVLVAPLPQYGGYGVNILENDYTFMNLIAKEIKGLEDISFDGRSQSDDELDERANAALDVVERKRTYLIPIVGEMASDYLTGVIDAHR